MINNFLLFECLYSSSKYLIIKELDKRNYPNLHIHHHRSRLDSQIRLAESPTKYRKVRSTSQRGTNKMSFFFSCPVDETYGTVQPFKRFLRFAIPHDLVGSFNAARDLRCGSPFVLYVFTANCANCINYTVINNKSRPVQFP